MDRTDALQKALGLMDPDGLLRSNDDKRIRIEKMVQGWIESYGECVAFNMCCRSQRILKAWQMGHVKA